MWTVFIVLILVGALIGYFIRAARNRGRQLAILVEQGVEATARVTARREVRDAEGSVMRREIRYRFHDRRGKSRTRSIVVDQAAFDDHPEGATLTVYYQPDKPTNSAAWFTIQSFARAKG